MKTGKVVFRIIVVVWLGIITLGVMAIFVTQQRIKNIQLKTFQMIISMQQANITSDSFLLVINRDVSQSGRDNQERLFNEFKKFLKEYERIDTWEELAFAKW